MARRRELTRPGGALPPKISRSLSVKAKLIIGRRSEFSRADEPVEDRKRAGVAVPHLEREITYEAVAAENLHAFVRDPHSGLGGIKLRESSAAGRIFRVVDFYSRPQHHPPHGLDFDVHVGPA